jgi:hypothetical protein
MTRIMFLQHISMHITGINVKDIQLLLKKQMAKFLTRNATLCVQTIMILAYV